LIYQLSGEQIMNSRHRILNNFYYRQPMGESRHVIPEPVSDPEMADSLRKLADGFNQDFVGPQANRYISALNHAADEIERLRKICDQIASR
jgi:dGTP triphosphohydrolase